MPRITKIFLNVILYNHIQWYIINFQQQMVVCDKRFLFGVLGCFGGLFIHLVIGSLYQWGIINIYITSYFRTLDPAVTLQSNAIVFPIIMLCIGVTMRVGLYIAQNGVHALIVMSVVVLLQALFVFVSSFIRNMAGFIIVYGVLFGLVSGFNFMIPVVECNKYFPGKKMYVNGVVLTGTGLGSLVFGLFSYSFLNPSKIPPLQGYYIGTQQLQAIATKVPQLLRWLSLLYLICGSLGVLLLSYVCIQNRKQDVKIQEQARSIVAEEISRHNQQIGENNSNAELQNVKVMQDVKNQSNGAKIDKSINKQESVPGEPTANNSNRNKVTNQFNNDIATNLQNNVQNPIAPQPIILTYPPPASIPPTNLDSTHLGFPTSIWQAFCSRIWWLLVAITFFGSCGLFLLNGNYKTYVKANINNDQMLTVIGVMNALGNGFSRFFWNLLFNHTGYRFVMVLNTLLQIIIFATLRFTVVSIGGYLFCIFIAGCCMGGYLVMTPTVLQNIFGQNIGSNVYGFFWEIFALTNLLQFAFVSGLSKIITFNGIIYICLGMTVFAGFLIIFGNFLAPWNNPQDQMGYCKDWVDKKRVQQENAQPNNVQENVQNQTSK